VYQDGKPDDFSNYHAGGGPGFIIIGVVKTKETGGSGGKITSQGANGHE
jgi:hypothetical protein